MKKVFAFALIVIIFFISCRSKIIIPKRDMVSLLVKIQLLDASIQSSKFRHKNNGSKDTLDYYSKTIESFGYTESQFDSSLKFYSKSSKELDAIYDEVIIELSKIEMKVIAENKEKEDSIALDTLKNLWPLKPQWDVPAEGATNPVAFEIPVVGEGIYTISADIVIYPDDESVNPTLTASFFFDDKSKKGNISEYTTKKINKDGVQRNYKIIIELKNALVTHLKGFILDHHNSNTEFKKHASASNITITYKLSQKNKKSVKAKPTHKKIEKL